MDRVRQIRDNIMLAVFESKKRDTNVIVTPDQLKPGHPRRDELAAEMFGKGTTAADDAETELSVYNVNKFACDTVALGHETTLMPLIRNSTDQRICRYQIRK